MQFVGPFGEQMPRVIQEPLSANVSPNRINACVSGNSVRSERRVRSFIFVYPQGTPAKYTRATRLCAFRTLSGAAVCAPAPSLLMSSSSAASPPICDLLCLRFHPPLAVGPFITAACTRIAAAATATPARSRLT